MHASFLKLLKQNKTNVEPQLINREDLHAHLPDIGEIWKVVVDRI